MEPAETRDQSTYKLMQEVKADLQTLANIYEHDGMPFFIRHKIRTARRLVADCDEIYWHRAYGDELGV